jgi:hypothetical protein
MIICLAFKNLWFVALSAAKLGTELKLGEKGRGCKPLDAKY